MNLRNHQVVVDNYRPDVKQAWPPRRAAIAQAIVSAFQAAYKHDKTVEPLIADAYAIQSWDAMQALDEALKRTRGDIADTTAFAPAIESATFKSPRGDFKFDPSTHNPTQDIYVRQVSESTGKAANAVIETLPKVADPG